MDQARFRIYSKAEQHPACATVAREISGNDDLQGMSFTLRSQVIEQRRKCEHFDRYDRCKDFSVPAQPNIPRSMRR